MVYIRGGPCFPSL